MHIAIIADPIDSQKAGIHTYTKKLIENLLKIDQKNTYSFIHERENSFFKNTNHYVIPKKKSLGANTIRKFLLIPRLIKKLRPDIVIEPCHIGPFALPKDIKRVTVIHDLTPVIFPKFHIARSTIIHKLLLGRALKNTDLIITASERNKKDIAARYNIKAPIEIIPLGVDQPKISPKKPPTASPYILFLGTIEPRKNLDILIEAFSELKKEEHLPHKLVLAGEIGWKCKNLLKKIKEFPNEIILTGYLTEDDKAAYYQNAEIFVYPSIYEGFGLPPLEAMSYGIPVICSSGGSLEEIFKDHCLIFNPSDKEDLKIQISSLLKNPELRKTLAENGAHYTENFSWESTAQKTLKALARLL